MNGDLPAAKPVAEPPIQLGLRPNVGHIALLVVVSGLVGGMLGQEHRPPPPLPLTSSGSPGSRRR